MTGVWSAASLLGAYLAGSFPTAVLVARARGVDITLTGSGNPGASNVARSLGKKMGLLVLVVDVAKGLGPTLAVKLAFAGEHYRAWLVAGAALAAVLGHVFPIWLRRKGGKGVATAFGGLAAISYSAVLVAVSVWLAVVLPTRFSSLGSLCAVTAIPLVLVFEDAPWPYVISWVSVWLLVVVRPRGNISRLWRHKERRV